MKKIIISIFLAIIMLLIPIASAVQTANISVKKNLYMTSEELPEFYITSEQSIILTSYIEANFIGNEKQEAIDVVNNIVNSELEVNLTNLANNLEIYIYAPISETELSKVNSMDQLDALLLEHWGFDENGFLQSLFGALLIKIVEFIKDRLGWIYDLFDKSITLFYDSINLLINTVKPLGLIAAVSFVAVINNILAAPKAFYEALKELFQPEGDNFIDTLIIFADNFATDLSKLIDDVLVIIHNQEIRTYFTQLQDYFNWLDAEPWKDPILINGSIKTLMGEAWTDITVTCKGQTTGIDNNGEFSFYVNPTPDEDSYPEFEYYGVHNCQITVTKDDGTVLKQTSSILSYSFSGGEISWPFIIPKAKNKVLPFITILIERLNSMIERFHAFSPYFLRNINRLETS
jgi:hypothetical protein